MTLKRRITVEVKDGRLVAPTSRANT